MQHIQIKDNSTPNRSIKIARFDQNKRKSTPHKHKNYLEIVVLTEAKGIHIIDAKSYQINQPMAFFLRRGQVHNWNLKGDVQGFVFIIKNEFIQQCDDQNIKTLLDILTQQQGLILNQLDAINTIGNLLVQEDNTKSKAYIEGLLKAFLAKLQTHQVELIPEKTSQYALYNQFIEGLEQNSPIPLRVNQHAAQLGTSPQFLSAICKKESGYSAAELINQAILNEAIRLLYYSELTIAEIAHRLEFKDDSHFIKFFKRFHKVTPGQYRLYQD